MCRSLIWCLEERRHITIPTSSDTFARFAREARGARGARAERARSARGARAKAREARTKRAPRAFVCVCVWGGVLQNLYTLPNHYTLGTALRTDSIDLLAMLLHT